MLGIQLLSLVGVIVLSIRAEMGVGGLSERTKRIIVIIIALMGMTSIALEWVGRALIRHGSKPPVVQFVPIRVIAQAGPAPWRT